MIPVPVKSSFAQVRSSTQDDPAKLLKTPFFVHFAKFGSSVGGIVSELPTNRSELWYGLKPCPAKRRAGQIEVRCLAGC